MCSFHLRFAPYFVCSMLQDSGCVALFQYLQIMTIIWSQAQHKMESILGNLWCYSFFFFQSKSVGNSNLGMPSQEVRQEVRLRQQLHVVMTTEDEEVGEDRFHGELFQGLPLLWRRKRIKGKNRQIRSKGQGNVPPVSSSSTWFHYAWAACSCTYING